MKMIWLWLILIVGVLLVGSITVLSKNQPLLEKGFKEIRTFVYGGEPEPIEDVTYTTSTETRCKDGTCTLVLYSGIRFVEEGNKWKKVEEARSLKDKGFEIVYLEDDTFHKIEVIDFNMTFIEFQLSYNNNSPRFEEFEHEIEDGKLKTKFKIIDNKGNETEYEIEIEDEEKSFVYSGNPLGKKFKFGENSTIIQLQEADTENLDDTCVDNDAGDEDEEFGTCTYLRVLIESGDDITGYIKFNLISVPNGADITNALLGVMLDGNGIDAGEGEDVEVHHVYHNYTIGGSEWTEGDQCAQVGEDPEMDWDNQPSEGEYNSTAEDSITFDNNSAEDFWYVWNVTNMVKSDFSGGYNNVTIMLLGANEIGLENFDYLTFNPKEDSPASTRPYINITYTEKVDETAPTVSLIVIANNSYWDVDNTPDFNYSATDDTAVTNCSLFINNTYNKSNDGTANFTNTAITNGSYEWFVNCSDLVENWGYSGFFNLKVNYSIPDTTPPTVTLITPANNSVWDIDNTPDFNYSATDNVGVTNCSLFINETYNQSNDGTTNFTNTTISNGNYHWFVNCSDLVENWGYSGFYNITINYLFNYISDCTTLDVVGTTYYLTQDIIDSSDSNCMEITANNVNLDCQGYTIDSNNIADRGIYLNNVKNITIKNCVLNDWDTTALYIHETNNSLIQNITITDSEDEGIQFSNSIFNIINNSFINNSGDWDILITGALNQKHCANELRNVNGTENKPIIWVNDTRTIENWNNNVSMIILCRANNTIVNNLNLTHEIITNNGLQIWHSSHIIINNSHFENLYWANDITSGENISIHNSNYKNNQLDDIFFYSTTDGEVINTNFTSSGDDSINFFAADNYLIKNVRIDGGGGIANGIVIKQQENGNIINSTIFNCGTGLYMHLTENNNVTGSGFYDNSVNGIRFGSNVNNSIYNNLFNNTVNVLFDGTIYNNSWNITNQIGTRIYSSGTNIGGNYWTNSSGDDYSDTCTDSDKDGFCDTAYNVSSSKAVSGTGFWSNVDYLPLSDEYSAAVDVCDCPSSGNWNINDGSICQPASNCNIGTNKLRITDGGLLIDSGINVRAGGCYVKDGERLFIEDGGGLYCGS